VGGTGIDRLIREFLDEGSVEDLELGVVQGTRLPPFKLQRP